MMRSFERSPRPSMQRRERPGLRPFAAPDSTGAVPGTDSAPDSAPGTAADSTPDAAADSTPDAAADAHQSFARLSVHSRRRPVVQARLRVQRSDDHAEAEADRVAEAALQSPQAGVAVNARPPVGTPLTSDISTRIEQQRGRGQALPPAPHARRLSRRLLPI